MSLAALIERLERATGPDRELDLAIHIAIDPDGNIAHVTQEYPRGLNHQEGYAWDFYQKSIVYEKWTSDGRCPVNGGYPLPEYTALIDAAMELVPEGHHVGLDTAIPGEPYSFASIKLNGDPVGHPANHSGRTPAIALCIASLKSRDVTP